MDWINQGDLELELLSAYTPLYALTRQQKEYRRVVRVKLARYWLPTRENSYKVIYSRVHSNIA